MKRKRQSIAALRRLAREAADAFDRYADKLEIGLAVPSRIVDTSTTFTRYDGDLMRQHTKGERIGHPRTPWHVHPTPEACREAAALLRRNPDSIGKTPNWSMSGSQIERTVKDARRLYGDDAAAVLCRQLETIDPDDYHAPAVRRWNAALRQMVNGDFKRQSRPTTG